MFAFECAVDKPSIWFIEKTPASMTLFKFHFIVIFMYTMLFIFVLYTIPYKYDRIKKTKKEKMVEKKEQKKRNKRKKKKIRGTIGTQNISLIIEQMFNYDLGTKKRNTITIQRTRSRMLLESAEERPLSKRLLDPQDL